MLPRSNTTRLTHSPFIEYEVENLRFLRVKRRCLPPFPHNVRLLKNNTFMIGAGPQWSQTLNGVGKFGAEFALDFMFWPTKDRKLGWFIEPTYSYSFAREHEQSLGVSMGLLISIQPN